MTTIFPSALGAQTITEPQRIESTTSNNNQAVARPIATHGVGPSIPATTQPSSVTSQVASTITTTANTTKAPPNPKKRQKDLDADIPSSPSTTSQQQTVPFVLPVVDARHILVNELEGISNINSAISYFTSSSRQSNPFQDLWTQLTNILSTNNSIPEESKLSLTDLTKSTSFLIFKAIGNKIKSGQGPQQESIQSLINLVGSLGSRSDCIQLLQNNFQYLYLTCCALWLLERCYVYEWLDEALQQRAIPVVASLYNALHTAHEQAERKGNIKLVLENTPYIARFLNNKACVLAVEELSILFIKTNTTTKKFDGNEILLHAINCLSTLHTSNIQWEYIQYAFGYLYIMFANISAQLSDTEGMTARRSSLQAKQSTMRVDINKSISVLLGLIDTLTQATPPASAHNDYKATIRNAMYLLVYYHLYRIDTLISHEMFLSKSQLLLTALSKLPPDPSILSDLQSLLRYLSLPIDNSVVLPNRPESVPPVPPLSSRFEERLSLPTITNSTSSTPIPRISPPLTVGTPASTPPLPGSETNEGSSPMAIPPREKLTPPPREKTPLSLSPPNFSASTATLATLSLTQPSAARSPSPPCEPPLPPPPGPS